MSAFDGVEQNNKRRLVLGRDFVAGEFLNPFLGAGKLVSNLVSL